MAKIIQYDKRSGLTYVYESISYWDKEKKQPRSKRKLIGKLDPNTGEIIGTDGRGKTRNKERGFAKAQIETQRHFYGATYLLDEIGKKLGLTEDLKICFPDSYKQILSIAYYLVPEENSPLYRFEKREKLHKHPYEKDIPSKRSSELFAGITEDKKNRFLKIFAKRHSEKECWVYDTTSISSYSETLNQVQYGKNKEGDNLPQINLALVYGESSNLPFYYRKLAGNISDVSTIKVLLADFSALGFKNQKFIMDRRFYSESNVNALFRTRSKFLIALKTSLVLVRNELDKATEDKKIFDKRLREMHKEIINGEANPLKEKAYKKYFNVDDSIKITLNKEVVKKATQYYGCFALLSNEKMDSISALELYRNKDVIEKAFGNIKERLNFRRPLVSSDQSLDGKLFVTYIGLIYLSYIKKQMQNANLFSKFTLQSLLDKLDVIECYTQSGRELRIGEITEKQNQIYRDLMLDPPKT